MTIEITKDIARKVLETVDAGLSRGLGTPIPGQMCVEAAVCYALDLPHGDDPVCVSPAVRAFKVTLNDATWSSPTARAAGMRRLALIQLGSAGAALADTEFASRIAEIAIRKAVPTALRAAASVHPNVKHKTALLRHADTCEREGTNAATYAADAADAANAATCAANAATCAANAAAYATYAATCAAYAANAATCAANAAAYAANATYATYAANAATCAANAARDKVLADFAEATVQLLIEMKAPGAQWLDLAPY